MGRPAPPAISGAISETRAGNRLRVFLEDFLENNYWDFLGLPRILLGFYQETETSQDFLGLLNYGEPWIP